MFIVICYARIFYIVRRTAIRSREPALRPGISTRTIDRPHNNNNSNSNSNEGQQQQPPAQQPPDNCDNVYEEDGRDRRRRASSSVEKDSMDGVVIQTTSEKRRGLLTKIKDEDLKFIDTSIDSDNNNYLIRNMTTTAADGLSVELAVSEGDTEDEGTHGNNGLLVTDKSDSALEEEESTLAEATKTTATMTMNGSQYLAVLVEPSSSSGIDVALDQDEPVQPM